MATTKEQKKEQFAFLKDKFGKMKAVVFAGYRGMSVTSVSKLRKNLREQGVDYKVAKKNLMRMAAEHAKVEGFTTEQFDGPVAVAIGYEDEVTPAKIVKTFMKEDPNLSIFGGIMGGKMLTKEQVIALASLPGMQELRAKLLGSMMSPVGGFVRVSNGVLGGFVRVLNGLAQKGAK